MGTVVDRQSGREGKWETCCVSLGSSLMVAMAVALAMAMLAAVKWSELPLLLGDLLAPLVTWDPNLCGYVM